MSKNGERVFVTGATGFVGSFVLEHLRREPSREVALLNRADSDPWRLESETLNGTTVIKGDLDQPEAFRDALAAFQPDTVVHLAWNGVGPKQRNDAAQLMNIRATIDLLQIAHAVGCRNFIGMGSQAEYGPHLSRIRESDATRPTTLYGASKLSVCHLGRLSAEQNQLRFAWLRIFSTYGPKDHPRWLIPYVILCLLRGERPKLTEGRQNWDFINVRDIASAVVAVVDDSDAEGIYNVGSGRVVTIRRVVERIRDYIDPALPLGLGELLYRPDQVMHLEADISRLQRATDWSPTVDLDHGLAETIDWYRQSGGERIA